MCQFILRFQMYYDYHYLYVIDIIIFNFIGTVHAYNLWRHIYQSVGMF